MAATSVIARSNTITSLGADRKSLFDIQVNLDSTFSLIPRDRHGDSKQEQPNKADNQQETTVGCILTTSKCDLQELTKAMSTSAEVIAELIEATFDLSSCETEEGATVAVADNYSCTSMIVNDELFADEQDQDESVDQIQQERLQVTEIMPLMNAKEATEMPIEEHEKLADAIMDVDNASSHREPDNSSFSVANNETCPTALESESDLQLFELFAEKDEMQEIVPSQATSTETMDNDESTGTSVGPVEEAIAGEPAESNAPLEQTDNNTQQIPEKNVTKKPKHSILKKFAHLRWTKRSNTEVILAKLTKSLSKKRAA